MNKKVIMALLEAMCEEDATPTQTSHASWPTPGVSWIGEDVLIRTVTTYFTGHAERVMDGMVYLEDAAWVANTGRFNACLTTGSLTEVEPYPEGVWVNMDVIVDVSIWKHPLPRIVK